MARVRKSEGIELGWSEKGSCPVRFVEGLFEVEETAFAETMRAVTGTDAPRVMLVADANVVQRTEGLGTKIGRYVQAHGLTLAGSPVVLGGGEKIKADGIQCVQRIVSAAVEANVGVGDVMVVIGGGTLLDVAGFAASLIRGGLKTVRVPTTVAAMVDAAYAGTAYLNMAGRKDALGVTSRPSAVLVDVSFAKTVLDGVWRGGLGEIVRQLVPTNATLLKRLAKEAARLKERDLEALYEIVRECVASRAKKGPTSFALWSALRLEAMSGYKLPHGYAVPIGICIDLAYAGARGVIPEADRETVRRLLIDCGALDGLTHSQHLLSQPDGVLRGLDERVLATGSAAIELPTALGKSTIEEAPDREILRQAIKSLLVDSASL